MTKKTKPGEGKRYGQGKSTWLHMTDYNRAKRLAKAKKLSINALISVALKEYEMDLKNVADHQVIGP